MALPSNLFLKLGSEQAYVHGLLVDYLISKLYLFDLLLVGNVAIFLADQKNRHQLKKIKLKFKKIDFAILFLGVIFLTYQLFVSPTATIFLSVRLSLILIFLFFTFKDKAKTKDFYRALALSLSWQSFLAYYQFFNQKALAPYQWFGESNLQSLAGISRGTFIDQEKILPYGSTAHPNILAGTVVIFSMLLIESRHFRDEWEKIFLFNALVIALLTQSISALLVLILFFLWLNQLNRQLISVLAAVFFLLSPFFLKQGQNLIHNDYLSLSRRQWLNEAAIKMWQTKPIFGFGYHHFLYHLENYSQNKELLRFVQPVHHLGLLALSEGGIILVLIFTLLIIRYRKSYNWSKILIISPIAALDHYLLTQILGLVSLILLLRLSRRH